jgi:phosphate starvation-inducible PhoH-like protein
VVKEKFQERRTAALIPIVAKTPKQKYYLYMLQSGEFNAVVVEGLFGTGKSYVSACVAADALISGIVDKVIVARPYVQTGKSSGSKPGSALEKLYPYVRNVLDTMKKRMGDGPFSEALKDGLTGKIEVQEIESIRGRSFDEPSFLLIEEAQQTTPEEMKAIVTRVSDNCTLVISGDNNQSDIRGETGLSWFLNFVERHKIPNVGHVQFNDPSDIIRGGLCSDIARGLYADGVIK